MKKLLLVLFSLVLLVGCTNNSAQNGATEDLSGSTQKKEEETAWGDTVPSSTEEGNLRA